MNEDASTPDSPRDSADGVPTPSVSAPGELAGLDQGAPTLMRLKIVGLLIFVLWLPFDLWSKDYMQELLGLVAGQPRSAHEIDVVPGFLAWQGTWNPGVTFGLAGGQTNIILALTSLATIGLIIWFFGTRMRSRCLHVGLALILSGAIGNLWDRWQWGQVRDFILVYLGDLTDPSWTWPNFNVADAGIVVGVSLVMWDALFGHGAHVAKLKAEARKLQKASS